MKTIADYLIDGDHPHWEDFLSINEYHMAKEKWQERRRSLQEEFKNDLIKHCGIENHPKARKAYDYIATEYFDIDGILTTNGLFKIKRTFEIIADLMKVD
jgi:hypothetical protein